MKSIIFAHTCKWILSIYVIIFNDICDLASTTGLHFLYGMTRRLNHCSYYIWNNWSHIQQPIDVMQIQYECSLLTWIWKECWKIKGKAAVLNEETVKAEDCTSPAVVSIVSVSIRINCQVVSSIRLTESDNHFMSILKCYM